MIKFSNLIGLDVLGRLYDQNSFIEADGKEKEIDAQNGLSLLEVAHNNEFIRGACEGSLACSPYNFREKIF